MNFSIIPLHDGNKAKIYTIQFSDKELSEYEQFVYENMSKVPNSVRVLKTQLKRMANKSGLVEHFFKRETEYPYNVFKIEDNIEDTEEYLRLYCIKFSSVAIVLGGGGIKIPGKVKLIDNPHLNDVCELLKKIEDLIVARIKAKEIILTDDELQGDLIFNNVNLI